MRNQIQKPIEVIRIETDTAIRYVAGDGFSKEFCVHAIKILDQSCEECKEMSEGIWLA